MGMSSGISCAMLSASRNARGVVIGRLPQSGGVVIGRQWHNLSAVGGSYNGAFPREVVTAAVPLVQNCVGCCNSSSSSWVARGPGQHQGYGPVLPPALLLSPALRVSYTTVYVPHGHAFHTSTKTYSKDTDDVSSQVKATVTDLKSDLKEKAKAAGSPLASEKRAVVAAKKTILVRVKEEIVHYYHGFRLLFIDTRIATRYVYQILNGDSLTRREQRQLLRTVTDLFRLVPFAVFVIIPFMELLLPVALKLFPGMLPSTFESANEKEAKMKKTLKMKIEMAKFLQKTLDNMPSQATERSRSSQTAKDFTQFYDKVQTRGGEVSNKEIMNFSKLFEDEITLDSLSRQQLIALCKMLEIQAFGTNNFLRFQIRMKVRGLIADDKTIQQEGVDSLAVWELQQACKSRGMRAYGLSKQRLQNQMKQWLELSLNEQVPTSLLLMSRMLFVTPDVTPESLAATISTLPEEVATLTKAKIGKSEGKMDNKIRLEVIQTEEKKIKADKQELLAADEERKKRDESLKKKAEEETKKLEAQRKAVEATQADILATASMDSQVDLPLSTGKILAEGIQVTKATVSHTGEIEADPELLVDTAPVLVDKATVLEPAEVLSEDIRVKAAKEQLSSLLQQELTADDLHDVEEALQFLGIEKKQLLYETKELSALKSELASYQEHNEEFKQALMDANIDKKELRESKSAKRLYHKVNKMINRMDPLLTALSKEKDSLQRIVDAGDAKQKHNGEKIKEEVLIEDKYTEGKPCDGNPIKVNENKERKLWDGWSDGQFRIDELAPILADLVSVEELITHISHISKAPDISKVEMIRSVLEKMDDDQDGAVKVEHVMRVLELMTHDKVVYSPKLFEEVIEMMAKEQQLETTKLIERALKSNADQPEPPVVEAPSAESTSYSDPPITSESTQAQETFDVETSQSDPLCHTEQDTIATKEDTASDLSLNLEESLEDSQKKNNNPLSSSEEEQSAPSQIDEAIIQSSSSSNGAQHNHKKHEVKQSH